MVWEELALGNRSVNRGTSDLYCWGFSLEIYDRGKGPLGYLWGYVEAKKVSYHWELPMWNCGGSPVRICGIYSVPDVLARDGSPSREGGETK